MQAAYPHCADRLFGRAHAIEPNAFRALIEGPAGKRILAGEPAGEEGSKPADAIRAIREQRLAMVEAEPVRTPGGDYAVTADGIAIVPVMGILSQRFDWLAAMCGWTTYEGLAAIFDAALDDDRVRAILMDVESPGGEAAGMLDAADRILATRQQKPVWAVANTFAASAAYAIAGSASRLYVPRLGMVGSIGAVCVHIDQSAQDAALGERYTAVYSGARKIDGWDHAPLSDEAQATYQRGVDHCRDQFAALVGRQGRMKKSAAIATEAAMYHDQEAVDADLADVVGSFDQALDDLRVEVARASRAERRARSVLLGTDSAGKLRPIDAHSPVRNMTATSQKGDGCKLCGAHGEPSASSQLPAFLRSALDASSWAEAILEACDERGASLREARAFIKLHSPIEYVRSELASRQPAPSAAMGPGFQYNWDHVASGHRPTPAGAILVDSRLTEEH